jgi:PGM1 C-terminal domain/ATP-grasp domain
MRDPEPGSAEELERFAELQARMRPLFERVFPDPTQHRTVVVVPSLSLDPQLLAKITGVRHYEERMLCLLMLLRLPRTHVVYVTSTLIDPSIVDYYLHLLPGIPGNHARKRLHLLTCHDGSPATLTEKILERPRLMRRIREAVRDPAAAHMTVFHATERERTLAVRLGLPLYACDPALAWLGSKSGGRDVFRKAGVLIPDGAEHLRDMEDVAEALAELKARDPALRRAAVKLEYGTSGEGNAVFGFDGAPSAGLGGWVREVLPERLRYESAVETWEHYGAKLAETGGIVEAWIEGDEKSSPSVQCRIDPLNQLSLISTHDQVLGGPSGQVFLGSTFPADEAYRADIQDVGLAVGEVLKGEGVLGRFGVDFVSVRRAGRWESYAIEINLRKGGTTHTYDILQFLTEGSYRPESGQFLTPQGAARFYYATDNLLKADYKRLTPEDLMDIATENGVHFDVAVQEGVFFHLIGALSGYGKLGVVCVASSPARARRLYAEVVEMLDREALAEA